MTDRLTAFAMANPDLGRVWMLQILASPNPSADKFWGEYVGSLRRFAATDLSQDGVDPEVLAVLTLAGTFLWPVWANAHAGNSAERSAMARRLADETLRLSLFGSMRAAAFPEIAGRLQGRVEIPVTA
jgi:hypothetical protein